MTIAERRERERQERENPWQNASCAHEDGTICELRMPNLCDYGRGRFFLSDGVWYRISPPERMHRDNVAEFRPSDVKLSAERRALVVERALRGQWEYRGGQLYRKPKAYKTYWRAENDRDEN